MSRDQYSFTNPVEQYGRVEPPVHLAEINFQAMYEQQQAQAAGEPSSILTQ